jgi:hypothetical protein
MAGKTEAFFGMQRRIIPAAAAAGGIFLLWLTSACSGMPASQNGLASATESGGINAPTPAADAQGVYPPPSDAVSVSNPKVVPHAVGTNAVYLPAIINQKPPQFPFEIQQTGVLAVQGFSGCNWSAVAGQIFDLSEVPVQNLILHLEGYWNGSAVSREALSGSATQYGPAGYEFVLGAQTLDSTQTLWIQVLDAAHKEISPRIYLDTYNDCARNLILVNFVQVR